MTRAEAIKRLKEYSQYAYGIYHNEQKDEEAFNMAIEALRHDVIFEQIKWERDVALDTLEEHGIGLGQKAEYIIPSGDVMFTSAVVQCKDCKHWYADADTGMACEFTNKGQPDDGYCNWGERKGGEDE